MKADFVALKKCAEVLPGFSTKGALVHDPAGTHQVIVAKHITAGKPYRFIEAHKLCITPKRTIDRYLLNPCDILFMSRGAGNYSVFLEEFPQPAIAPSTFYILKPTENICPAYLAWCLNQRPFQAKLKEIRTGAGTPMVPRKEFSGIRIYLPSLETQKKIAALGILMAKEEEILRQLLEETQRYHRLLGQSIARGRMQFNQ